MLSAMLLTNWPQVWLVRKVVLLLFVLCWNLEIADISARFYVQTIAKSNINILWKQGVDLPSAVEYIDHIFLFVDYRRGKLVRVICS